MNEIVAGVEDENDAGFLGFITECAFEWFGGRKRAPYILLIDPDGWPLEKHIRTKHSLGALVRVTLTILSGKHEIFT
jgi:hypothetical protein